jgi:signal transduction histidine kinase
VRRGLEKRRREGRQAPAPAEAGANLLVHDIKNLAGRLGLLLQNLDENYDDPLFKGTALGILDDTVVHLRRLATDLREHDGRVVIKLKVDLNQVLQAALVDARPDLVVDVGLIEEYAPLPEIWGDAYLLRRAFACAVDNALEAMEGRGLIKVSSQFIRRAGRERITVEIADNGPGMSEDFMKEVLAQPFATTKEEGMGLGVYTLRQVALLHGGRVRILSKEGEGTRVRFHFPVTR